MCRGHASYCATDSGANSRMLMPRVELMVHVWVLLFQELSDRDVAINDQSFKGNLILTSRIDPPPLTHPSCKILSLFRVNDWGTINEINTQS